MDPVASFLVLAMIGALAVVVVAVLANASQQQQVPSPGPPPPRSLFYMGVVRGPDRAGGRLLALAWVRTDGTEGVTRTGIVKSDAPVDEHPLTQCGADFEALCANGRTPEVFVWSDDDVLPLDMAVIDMESVAFEAETPEDPRLDGLRTMIGSAQSISEGLPVKTLSAACRRLGIDSAEKPSPTKATQLAANPKYEQLLHEALAKHMACLVSVHLRAATFRR